MKIDLKKEISLPKLGKPSLSKLGKPSLPGRTRRTNAAPPGRLGMPDIKAPKVVADLFGDLRDRHLLPLVALLIVAIIAAPIVFGGTGSSDEPVTSAAIPGGETADSAFTVVPAEESLRSPEKRLGHRHPLNPFRTAPAKVNSPVSSKQSQEFAAAAVVGAAAGAASSPESSSTESSTVESAPVESSGEVGATESSTPETTEAPTTTESTTTTEKETVTVEPQYVVTLKTGFTTGKLQEQTDVQPMTKLAGEKDPAILYIGMTQDQKRALFLLTSQVTAYYGAAHCTLDKTACELIELKPGKSATFEIGLGAAATRYKVFVKSIDAVVAGEETKATKKTETRSSEAKPRPSYLGAAQRFSK